MKNSGSGRGRQVFERRVISPRNKITQSTLPSSQLGRRHDVFLFAQVSVLLEDVSTTPVDSATLNYEVAYAVVRVERGCYFIEEDCDFP